MKISYDKEVGVSIHFNVDELKFALQVLKAIQTVAGQDFIRKCIEDIEYDLKPKLLPFINHFHYCTRCLCEIDDRVADNFVHVTKDDMDEWLHIQCPPLKEVRPN